LIGFDRKQRRINGDQGHVQALGVMFQSLEPLIATDAVELLVRHGCGERGFGIRCQSSEPFAPCGEHSTVGSQASGLCEWRVRCT
jgi:hypothetical protein